MNPYMLILPICYLLGSIPFGLLISRTQGIDIRTQGSGNIGATNVFRMVGKKWGLFCFVLDFLKGLISAWVLPMVLSPQAGVEFRLLAGVCAILGHSFPVWLKFKGGKGVATSAGVIAAVAPASFAVAFVVWFLTMILSRIVSLSSILAAIAVAVSGWMLPPQSLIVDGLLSLIGVVVVVRHRTNILRLLKGEEHKFGKKKPNVER